MAELACAEALDSQIQQRVGRSTVPAADRGAPVWPLLGGQQRQVGDAAEVQQGAPATDAGQQGPIRDWHQRCPLATAGQVGPTEITNQRFPEQFGQQRPIQRLPAGAPLVAAGGAVPEGLAMAAH